MTRNSRHLAFASAVASAVLLAACVDDSADAPPPGGSVEVSSMDFGGANPSVSASAIFIASVSTSGAPVAASVFPDMKLDTCTGFELPTPTPILQPIVTTKDVGGLVNLETGVAAERIRLVRDIFGDQISYNPEDVIEPALGKAFDVTLGGGGSTVPETTWAGAFRLPTELSMGAGTGTFNIVQGGAVDLIWEPTGADAIVLFLFGGDTQSSATCLIADDGSFTLPASLIADLDEFGTLTVQSIIEEKKTLDGRRVNLVGRTGFARSYLLVDAPTPTPTPTGTATPTPTPGIPWSASGAPSLALVDNGTACTELTVPQAGNASEAKVNLAGVHTYGSEIRGTLEHNGQLGDVFPVGTFVNDIDAFSLTNTPVAGFTGSSAGVWILCIVDTAAQDTGTLNTWSVHN